MTRTFLAPIAALILLAPGLTGCAGLVSGGLSAVGVTPAVQHTVHLDTGKALDLAYNGLDFVTVGLVEPAVLSGAIHGPNAAKVAGALKQARGILDTAYNAYHAGIASDPTAAINSALALLDQIKSVLNGAGVATPSGPAPAAYHLTPEASARSFDRVLAELRSA